MPQAGSPLVFSNSRLVVRGFMEAFTYHSILNISVLPVKRYKFIVTFAEISLEYKIVQFKNFYSITCSCKFYTFLDE
jgi:hypothetical protein